jgi:hypothetical protein
MINKLIELDISAMVFLLTGLLVYNIIGDKPFGILLIGAGVGCLYSYVYLYYGRKVKI